jgi:pyrroloquinoline quinone biosynthesis protein B
VITAVLLGNAQDAGLPQAGCECENCQAAWQHPHLRRQAACLGLLDGDQGVFFLIDATPGFREQLHSIQTLAPGAHLGGVLLTHAHMGHYTGLLHLGFEAMNARAVPLFATRQMLTFLSANAPWRQLLEQGNLAPRELEPAAWVSLSPGLSVQPLPVPHRAEWSDTLAFVVRGPRRRLLYLPDIDNWDAWAAASYNQDLRETVESVDTALLDGTFYTEAELPGRDLRAIGHPLVTDTAARLAGTRATVFFIHLNHSNPLHRDGPERAMLKAHRLEVGEQGMRLQL